MNEPRDLSSVAAAGTDPGVSVVATLALLGDDFGSGRTPAQD